MRSESRCVILVGPRESGSSHVTRTEDPVVSISCGEPRPLRCSAPKVPRRCVKSGRHSSFLSFLLRVQGVPTKSKSDLLIPNATSTLRPAGERWTDSLRMSAHLVTVSGPRPRKEAPRREGRLATPASSRRAVGTLTSPCCSGTVQLSLGVGQGRLQMVNPGHRAGARCSCRKRPVSSVLCVRFRDQRTRPLRLRSAGQRRPVAVLCLMGLCPPPGRRA